jgi:choline dehydrogenase-like flavoprotein
MSFVVIGSGPAGVAATQALVDSGRRVTVLDAGDTIEPGRMDTFDALAESEPESWQVNLARSARDSFPVTAKHVPLKPAYGSLFPYALDDLDLPVLCENAETLPSLALGGLSNAWGASMLPVRTQDIRDWPITLNELVPHYEAVLRFVPMAAERDELSEILPLYIDSPHRLRRTQQMEMVLARMRAHARSLQAAGFTVGGSRLALRTSDEDPARCRYSGLCLHGCPYHSIYNAAHTLEALVRDREVVYHGGVYVDRLIPTDDGVRIQAHQRGANNSKIELSASRVLVACGAVSSTRLVLASIGRIPDTRRLLDSQYFLIPMITARAVPMRVATQGNTLAQIFLELDCQSISRYTAHLQLYGYNDLMISPFAARLSLPADSVERLLGSVLRRVIVVQGYLHSDDSPALTIHVATDGVRLVGEDPRYGAARVRRLVRHLAAHARPLGMMPIPGLAQLGRPGKGNHLGGSFPMRRQPAEMETDALGRLPRWQRVHVVDASVLPSVPATTVTLSVMANAHRIATAAAATEC